MSQKEIDLSHNFLNIFSPHLGKLAGLRKLDLSYNHIHILSMPILVKLTQLMVIFIFLSLHYSL